MAELSFMTSVQVAEAIQELDELAGALGMPISERRSILGLSLDGYHSWYNGDFDDRTAVAPELIRRLNYALPLMRRMAAHMPVVPAGRSQNRLRPALN